MEKEKLDEGRKTFQEDKDKYEKFKQDLQSKVSDSEEDVRKVQRQIEILQGQIYDLKKEESQLTSQESKYQEDLQAFKRDKTFLDLLAISCKRKNIMLKQKDRKVQPNGLTFITEGGEQNKQKKSKVLVEQNENEL